MGYSIDDFLEDSDFEANCEQFFKNGNYTGDNDKYESLSSFLSCELSRICQMEEPADTDYRFEKYRKAFIASIFRAITGGDSESISLGERLSLIMYLLVEQPIALKYVDIHDTIVSYEFPFNDEEIVSARETIYLNNKDFDNFIAACNEAKEPNFELLKLVKDAKIRPGRLKDQISYDPDCFDPEDEL